MGSVIATVIVRKAMAWERSDMGGMQRLERGNWIPEVVMGSVGKGLDLYKK